MNGKIKDYIENDEIELEKIIKDYSNYTITIINNMVKDNLSKEDKEEILSEIFFIVWKNKDKLDINKNLSSYIAGVTKNIAKEYLRKIKINYNICDYENTLYSYDEIEIFNTNMETIRKIENKLNNMKEIDKKIFLEFYYYCKSIKDIAKEQNISVKQRLYRIRNKLKKEGR